MRDEGRKRKKTSNDEIRMTNEEENRGWVKMNSILMKNKKNVFKGKELLHSFMEELKDSGIQNSRYKSEYLLRDFFDCKRTDLYLKNFSLNEIEFKKLMDSLNRLKKNEPVQYVTNSSYFLDYKFYVKKGVFIPRPETEILVKELIHNYKNCKKKLYGLDVGTGCGNIPISIVEKLQNVRMVATDISYENIKVAKFNALRYEVIRRIKFERCDLFPSANSKKYDFIISNPPYVRRKNLKNLPPEVQYEPSTALNGKEEGMEFYNRLISRSEDLLHTGSKIFLEIGFKQRDLIKKLIRRYSNLRLKKFSFDYNGQYRVAIIERI